MVDISGIHFHDSQIPRVELRTNRLVNESLGERARPGRSQRRPRRWHERTRTRDSRAFSNLLAHEVRCALAPNCSLGGCVPPISFQSMAHFQCCASRFSIPVKTTSAGIPACGFFRSSSARRSSSLICSDVSSSSNSVNSSRIFRTSSRRSFSGRPLMLSRISSAVMTKNYFALSQFASA
jgi:hypothetical protein